LEVRIAREHGFCIGVRKAVELAQEVAEEAQAAGKSAYTLGPLIHNRRVVDKLRSLGVFPAKTISDVPDGSILIMPSHGAGPELIEAAEARGIDVRDATCPLVRKVQTAARTLREEDYNVIVVGQKTHAEVRAVVAWAGGDVFVVENTDEAAAFPEMDKVAVVSQTTQRPEQVSRIVKVLQGKCGEVRVEPTLCHVTSQRQAEVRRLARKVDVIIVVGGRESANTRKLVEIGREMGRRVYHVEAAHEVDPSWFRPTDKVGVTAGTSTPDWITEEVVARMEEMDPNVEAKVEEGENGTSPSATSPEVTAPPERQAEPSPDGETEDAKAEDLAPVTVKRGTRVTGTVVKVGQEEVLLDIGYKTEGVLPVSEYGRRPPENLEEEVKEGDTLETVVLRVDDEGRPVLSRKPVEEDEAWKVLEAAFEDGLTIDAPVTVKVKGGLVADVGTRGFIPASQVGLEYIEDLGPYVGKTLKVKVIELDRDENRVILSEKRYLEEERGQQRRDLVDSLQEGEIREGEVKRVTDYGAFVDIGGVDGLLHVSEMSWKRISNPRDVVKEGDKIEVAVLKVDRERERISLGLKQVGPDPWEEVPERFPVGSIVEGTVVSVADFGAFVELGEGIEGLVHVSQLSDRRVAHPSDVAKVGDKLRVKVLKVNPSERRISLSARGAEDELDRRQVRKYLKGSRDDSVVTIGDMVGDLLQGANLGEDAGDEEDESEE